MKPVPKATFTINRASPSLSLMKVESVKSSISGANRTGSSSAKAASAAKLHGCHTMVLKSNVAMAAELPKTMGKPPVKKSGA